MIQPLGVQSAVSVSSEARGCTGGGSAVSAKTEVMHAVKLTGKRLSKKDRGTLLNTQFNSWGLTFGAGAGSDSSRLRCTSMTYRSLHGLDLRVLGAS